MKLDGVGMYLTNDVSYDEYEVYEHPGTKGVKRRRLLNPENSSKTFAVRAYIIEPGGHTSYDIHPHEHGVYMMTGTVAVYVEGQEISLHPGDVLHIGSKEAHQFFNRGSDLVKFLCVRNFISS